MPARSWGSSPTTTRSAPCCRAEPSWPWSGAAAIASSSTAGNQRRFARHTLRRIAYVRAAQRFGLSLAEIREIIAARERGGPPCGHVSALLDAHAVDLDRLRQERLRVGYLALAAEFPERCRVVPADGPPEAVAARIFAEVAA